MAKTKHIHEMYDTNAVAKQATKHIEKYLRSRKETVNVLNVEDDKEHQLKDIDLIWEYAKDFTVKKLTIELKADRYHRTGNYFFETISNEQRGTPGCFMYSQADYLFYYFVTIRELHIIPLKAARKWFIEHMEEFVEERTSTPIKNGEYYNTVGRLVPKNRLQAEVEGVKIRKI